MLASVTLLATASPPCTLNIPAHNVHYDLRGVPGVSGIYQGSSDRSVNEGERQPEHRAGEGRGIGRRRPHERLVLDHQPLHLREYVRSARLQVIFCVNMRALGTCYVLASNGNSRVKKR